MPEVEPAPSPAPSPPRSVLDSARDHELDRYLSALLAPGGVRGDLVVLAAYLGEVRRVPLIAEEPGIGEIRLQWWRDALAEGAGLSGHPVADAVTEMARRRGLRRDLLLAPTEGASRLLYEDGIRDERDFRLYAEETEGAALRLALAILGGGAQVDSESLSDAARALALTRLALTLPQHLAYGRLPLPAARIESSGDPRLCGPEAARAATRSLLVGLSEEASAALAAFRARQDRVETRAFAAFLPMALIEPYLKAVTRANRDVLVDLVEISPLSRVVRLWFAHWRGRV